MTGVFSYLGYRQCFRETCLDLLNPQLVFGQIGMPNYIIPNYHSSMEQTNGK